MAEQINSSLQHGHRRTLFLAALGAIAGLGMAGFGLFTAKGTSTLFVPAEHVALVNQQPISQVDYHTAIQTLYAVPFDQVTAEQRRRVLDDLIREELLVQRGKELDVSLTDPEVRAAMVSSVEQQAAMSAYTEQPSDAKLQAFFAAHRINYASEGTIAVRDLVFTEQVSAKAASAALKAGQPVEAVLKNFKGHETGSVTGNEFYFAAKIHLGEALFAAAQGLPSGGISEPIEAEGFHVLITTKNIPPEPYTFEAARTQVLRDYRRETATRLHTANDEFLRKRATILIAEGLQ